MCEVANLVQCLINRIKRIGLITHLDLLFFLFQSSINYSIHYYLNHSIIINHHSSTTTTVLTPPTTTILTPPTTTTLTPPTPPPDYSSITLV